MKMCSVCTYEYETNLSKLLERRLTQSGFQGNVYAEDRAIEAEVKDEADLAKWCEAIARLRPFGVDVSSGIETGGYKDREKMTAFAAAVREEK